MCASGWRSERLFHDGIVVPTDTNESLRTTWLDVARGAERLVDSDVTVQHGVREHPFVGGVSTVWHGSYLCGL